MKKKIKSLLPLSLGGGCKAWPLIKYFFLRLPLFLSLKCPFLWLRRLSLLVQRVLEADGCGWVAHEVVGCGGVEVVRGTVGWDVVVRQSVRRGLQRLLDVLLLLAEFNSFIYLILFLYWTIQDTDFDPWYQISIGNTACLIILFRFLVHNKMVENYETEYIDVDNKVSVQYKFVFLCLIEKLALY